MKLTQQIETDFKTAYKAKDTVKVAVLRMLKTAMTNRVKDLGRELEDGEVLDLVSKEVKQRKESIDQFGKANRVDLVAVEEAELAVLETYLPTPLTEDELAAAVDAAVAETGAGSMQDMGRVMQALAAAHKGRYDGRRASEIVRSRLTG